jgi:3-oxocholest-4-en-26-oate---CoA ligase
VEKHIATVWESVADAVPDADAFVHLGRRISWAGFDDRAARLAGALEQAGLTRGSKVAEYLYNCPEYGETFYAGLKIRAIPVNVNYRYLDDELLYLLDNSEAEALVFHSSLGERVARVRDRAKHLKLVVEVDDGTGAGAVADAVPYEELLASATPAARRKRSSDDITMVYTGGTTGMPKGVMSKIGPGIDTLLASVPPLVGEAPLADPADIAAAATRVVADGRAPRSIPACPLMHGTGLAIGMIPALTFGGATVLLNGRRFDVDELWDVVEHEAATWIAIVGDAFARPMLRRLEEYEAEGRSRDLSSLKVISSSGAMFSAEVRTGMLERLPQAMIIDYIAATEGLMGVSISMNGAVAPTGRFMPAPGVKVLTDEGREVTPGSEEIGMVALTAGVPDGYYKDEAKSAKTFREIDGVRYSIPGDFAQVGADGLITLLGRGSQVINTGGEKVYPEEVEEAVKRHEAVDDCLVFGLPDERFGQRIAAVASLCADATPEEILDHVRQSLAGYKVPRDLMIVDEVPRAPNGKADYPSARELFTSVRT